MRHPLDSPTAERGALLRFNPFKNRREWWDPLFEQWIPDRLAHKIRGDRTVSYEDTWMEPEEDE